MTRSTMTAYILITIAGSTLGLVSTAHAATPTRLGAYVLCALAALAGAVGFDEWLRRRG